MDDENKKVEKNQNEKAETNKVIVFSNGFGTVVFLTLVSISPPANAGSAVFGPCGVHYT